MSPTHQVSQMRARSFDETNPPSLRLVSPMVGLIGRREHAEGHEPEEIVRALKYAAAIRVMDGEVHADDSFERIAGRYPSEV